MQSQDALCRILTENTDVRRFSKYGINVLLDLRLVRNAVLKVASSTHSF